MKVVYDLAPMRDVHTSLAARAQFVAWVRLSAIMSCSRVLGPVKVVGVGAPAGTILIRASLGAPERIYSLDPTFAVLGFPTLE